MPKIIIGWLLYCLSMSCVANDMYPFESPRQTAQFNYLLHELRCLVCQNQDLADSNAGLAKDLKNKIYEMIQSHKSDQEIVDYLTARYGEFILFRPPVKAATFILWFGPILFVLIGALIFVRTVKREH